MRAGRTLTSHFQLETRQHDLLGLDLGEGPPRRALIFGAVVFALWVLLCAPILGPPSQSTFSLYVIPPILLSAWGMQPSPRHPRRRRFTDWALTARHATRGHRPVIHLGARAAHRSEYLPLRRRLPLDTLTAAFLPWRATPEWEREHEEDSRPGHAGAGAGIRLRQRARLLDAEHVRAAREKTLRRMQRGGTPTGSDPATAAAKTASSTSTSTSTAPASLIRKATP